MDSDILSIPYKHLTMKTETTRDRQTDKGKWRLTARGSETQGRGEDEKSQAWTDLLFMFNLISYISNRTVNEDPTSFSTLPRHFKNKSGSRS